MRALFISTSLVFCTLTVNPAFAYVRLSDRTGNDSLPLYFGAFALISLLLSMPIGWVLGHFNARRNGEDGGIGGGTGALFGIIISLMIDIIILLILKDFNFN